MIPLSLPLEKRGEIFTIQFFYTQIILDYLSINAGETFVITYIYKQLKMAPREWRLVPHGTMIEVELLATQSS